MGLEIEPGWRTKFASEVDELFKRRLRVATSVLFVLHAVAFAVFPDRTGTTLDAALRFAMFPFSALLFACTWWRGLGRWVRAAAALMIFTVSAYAAWKNAKVGDPLDIRSLTLTILTAGLLFPFGFWGMFALSASVLAIYFAAIHSTGEFGQAAISGTFFLVCACALATLTAWLSTRLRASEFHARRDLKIANEQMDALLRDMLPEPIVARLKRERGVIADRHAEATVMFADIVGFTAMSSTMQPELLVRFLNSLFSELDALTTKLGLEKIKTIGDAYMVAAGLPEPRSDHAQAAIEMAMAMQRHLETMRAKHPELRLRIGIHTGPVVAGVIGENKFAYDLWGDNVNIASRMESHGLPGRIQVTEPFARALAGAWEFEDRGLIEVKGQGPMRTFLLKQ
jgi:adenylate cyclase